MHVTPRSTHATRPQACHTHCADTHAVECDSLASPGSPSAPPDVFLGWGGLVCGDVSCAFPQVRTLARGRITQADEPCLAGSHRACSNTEAAAVSCGLAARHFRKLRRPVAAPRFVAAVHLLAASAALLLHPCTPRLALAAPSPAGSLNVERTADCILAEGTKEAESTSMSSSGESMVCSSLGASPRTSNCITRKRSQRGHPATEPSEARKMLTLKHSGLVTRCSPRTLRCRGKWSRSLPGTWHAGVGFARWPC